MPFLGKGYEKATKNQYSIFKIFLIAVEYVYVECKPEASYFNQLFDK